MRQQKTGLAYATARLFAENGATVALLDLGSNSPQKKATILGENHRGYVCDVTQKEACETVAQQILQDFGGVDILINNAGITQPIRIVKPENYDAVLDVSLRGMLYLSQAFISHFISRGAGSIACTSSVSAQTGGGFFGSPHYSAAKAGMLGLAKVALLYLTNSPKEAKWLTDEEREAYERMMDQERKDVAAHGHADLRASLLSPQVWILGLAYCATVFGLTGLAFWMPQIIKQFNFSDTTVGLLSTIPYLIGALIMCWWAARSDARKERFWHFIVPSLIFPVGFAVTCTFFLTMGRALWDGYQHGGISIGGSRLLHLAGLFSRWRKRPREEWRFATRWAILVAFSDLGSSVMSSKDLARLQRWTFAPFLS